MLTSGAEGVNVKTLGAVSDVVPGITFGPLFNVIVFPRDAVDESALLNVATTTAFTGT